jgi:serine phosphatase RsbU (regulator of sigma subunit)
MTVRVAGHPPPLLCTSDGADYVDVAVGPPLGVRDEGAEIPGEWPVTSAQLPPGSSLLLYTDGLLDAYRRPENQTSVGLDELLEVARTALSSGQPVESLISTVVGNAPVRAADDTALVVLTVEDAPS